MHRVRNQALTTRNFRLWAIADVMNLPTFKRVIIGTAMAVVIPHSSQGAQLDNVAWRLRGIDVFGAHSGTRQGLIAEIPWSVGDRIAASAKPERDAWCARQKARFDLLYARCTLVLIQPDNAYLSVDVVEKGEDLRLPPPRAFRAAAQTLPAELNARFERLDNLRDEAFVRGAPIVDETDGRDYVDYEDPALHEAALEVRNAARPHRALLLEVLTNSANAEDRARAAELLNWAGQPTVTAELMIACMDDPDELVRNNVSRFLIKWAPGLERLETKDRLVRALAVQLDRPFFGDRNKALFVLDGLATSDPELRPLIARLAGAQIETLARQSVAPNVGGEAKALIQKLGL